MTAKAKRAPNRRKTAKAPLPLTESSNPRRMLPFKVWCALNDLSPDLGRRILRGATNIPSPKITQLSDRRIAIRADHNAEWQDARVRAEPKPQQTEKGHE